MERRARSPNVSGRGQATTRPSSTWLPAPRPVRRRARSGPAPPPPGPRGLTSAEARRRLAEAGPNTVEAARGPSQLRVFLANFVQLLALLLWVGAILALVAGLPQLSAAIVAVIIVNAIFSYVQQHRAERAVAALRRMLPLRVRVRRDGAPADVDGEEVVPGDVLLLAAGDRIAADADLLEASELRVDESTLSGESRPVAPRSEVFAGTYVTAGEAEAVVTATGMRTRFGRIAALAQQTRRERSPLERELDRLTHRVALISLAVGVVFFAAAGFTGMSATDRFVFAIGVAVALVPEGLLPTVTLSLALATQRMARRNALVRRLTSVETLGETTVVCTDKTGTLTENQMTVERIWADGREIAVEGVGYEPFGRFAEGGEVLDPAPLRELLRAGLLCNDARLVHGEGGYAVLGDPTEGALVVLAEKGGLRHEQEAARAPRLRELPFSSERKRMTTVHRVGRSGSPTRRARPRSCCPAARSARRSGRGRWPRRSRWSATRCASSPSRGAGSGRPTARRRPRRSSASWISSAWSGWSTRRGRRCPTRCVARAAPGSG